MTSNKVQAALVVGFSAGLGYLLVRHSPTWFTGPILGILAISLAAHHVRLREVNRRADRMIGLLSGALDRQRTLMDAMCKGLTGLKYDEFIAKHVVRSEEKTPKDSGN
jgi:hypothetical protein